MTAGLLHFKMKAILPLEVFHDETNFVVIKMPTRAYPGVLIQGDSLMSILGELSEAIENFKTDPEESLGCLKNAHEELEWRLAAYKKVCEENGIS